MYEKLSIRITNILVEYGFVQKNDSEIYIFSFQIILSSLVSSVFIAFWALLFRQVINTILFFVGFFLCRKCSGGYHAKTQIACFIFTQLIFLSFLFLITFSNFPENKIYIIFSTLFANSSIFFLAPVETENKPLDDIEKLKYKKQSKLFVLFNIIFYFFSLFIPNFDNKYSSYILGVSAISLMLILGKLKNIASSNSKSKKKGEECNE